MTVRKWVLFLVLFSAMSYWLTAQEKAVKVQFDVDDLDNQISSVVTASKQLNLNIEVNSIFENKNVTNNATAQNEAALAVNPANENNIVIAMNDYGVGNNGLSGQSVAYTMDGGATWTMRTIPVVSNDLQAIDPSIVFTNDGKLYMSYAAIRMVNKFTVGSGIFLVTSMDGGSTWSTPVAVVDGLNNALAVHTRPYLAVNPLNNELAIGWVKNEGSQNRATAFVTRTTDGSTFNEPVAINDPSARARNISISYNLQGELFAAWYDYNTATACVSKINGQSVQLLTSFAVHPIGSADGTSRILKSALKVNHYPVMAIDQSATKTAGMIYVVWADQLSGTPDIVMVSSKNNGASWTQPTAVNQNRSNDQFFPSVSVDSKTGTVNVLYYDSRNDVNNQLIDAYLSQSIDGGRSFVDVRLSNASFDPSVGPFSGRVIGDYIAVASNNNAVYTAWADTRKGDDQDIYFTKYQKSGVDNTTRSFVLNQNYPNPFNPVTQITFELNQEVHVSLAVYNSLGQLVKTLVNERRVEGVHTLNFNATELASGIYFYRLQAGDAVSVKKMLLVK